MNKNTSIIAIIVILLVAGGIYMLSAKKAPAPVENQEVVNQSPVNSGDYGLSVEPAAAVARKDLAAKLSVDEKSIVIMQITDTTWTDGCLGLGQANESCLQALVPGFKVEMQASGKTYIYRTDKTGDSVRAEVN